MTNITATKKGIALIVVFLAILVLTIMGAVIVNRSIYEHKIAQRYLESTQAFWLADAGINWALNELRQNFSASGTNIFSANLGGGSYSIDIENDISDSNKKNITVYGYVPSAASPRETRILHATVIRHTPADFFDNALYSSGSVTLNGDTYEINGDISYNTTINDDEYVNGNATADASSPLPRLDFDQLLSMSQTQGNVYNATRLADKDPFPSSFWYNQTTTTPNIVYIMGDLTLNGNIGTIGGFFVVVGDVINTPDITQDATINGNGQIDGLIYTRGEFRINGGGGNLNVNGGVWAGELARLNGNARLDYNETYMDAIAVLNITGYPQIGSWRDTQTVYPVQ